MVPNTYACKGVSNPNFPIFPPKVCTLVLFINVVLCNIYSKHCSKNILYRSLKKKKKNRNHVDMHSTIIIKSTKVQTLGRNIGTFGLDWKHQFACIMY